MRKVEGIIRPNLSLFVEQARVSVALAIEKFGSEEGWVGREGGYFCVADGKNGLPLLTVLIGKVPLEKALRYLNLCQEKAARLSMYPGHGSSWESRNPEENQWGGAIRVGTDFIFSLSGFPELGDEAVMLDTAWHINEPRVTLDRIAQHSGNQYWPVLRAA